MTVIGDDFTSPLGIFAPYATYDGDQNAQLQLQRHTDLRSFEEPDVLAPPTMLALDLLTMAALNAETMGAIEGSGGVVRFGEHWTSGVVGPQADRNNWRGITLSCSSGTNVTSSVLQKSAIASTGVGLIPIDITNYAASDYLTLALPDFPLADIDISNSFIDITSDPDGDPDMGPTDSLALGSTIRTLVAGDSEARFPLSLLTQVDRSQITGIRLRIEALGSCSFRCLAIRVVSSTWKYAPIDYDTLYDRIVHPVSPDGSLSTFFTFPQTSIPGLPNFWPITFWSNLPSGPGDPKPIDTKLGCWFNTGSMTDSDVTHKNRVSLYFRERREDEQTQLDLNGQIQAYLDALGHQPDYGDISYAGRAQGDLDGLSQAALDGDTQFTLERVPDALAAAWLEVKVVWYTGATAVVTIQDADQEGVSYSGINLDPNANYFLEVELEDTGVRVFIYEIDELGSVGTQVWDSTLIQDEALILRRKGRVGWYAEFYDHDAYLESIRPRAMMFGEYRSHPFRSRTPVDGASLYAQATPDRELVTTILPAVWGGIVSLDSTKSSSGEAYKIISKAGLPLQGVHTNTFVIDDWDETDITLDLFFPKSGLTHGRGLEAFLIGPNTTLVPLTLPIIATDQWQSIRIFPGAGQTLIGGIYELVIVQTLAPTETTWYVDNVSVSKRILKWQGRPKDPDPWNIVPSPWLDFKDTVNHPTGGIAFNRRGSALQIRGLARTQDAEIFNIKAIPRYASQGNLIWRSQDEAVTDTPNIPAGLEMLIGVAPTLTPLVYTIGTETITQQRVGVEVALTFSVTGLDLAHLPVGVTVLAYHWDFGDGTTSSLASPTHTYTRADIQTQVSLIVLDSLGREHSARKQIYITGVFARPIADIVLTGDNVARHFIGARLLGETHPTIDTTTAIRGAARSSSDALTTSDAVGYTVLHGLNPGGNLPGLIP
jgi:hypothetical protein